MKRNLTEYKIFAATKDEKDSGWVWIKDPDLPTRSIVSIRLEANHKKIYCEALQIEKNFLDNYNQKPRFKISNPTETIVMNHWYRSFLSNISTQEKYYFKITPENHWFGKLYSCIQHPQIVIRAATWLAILSVILGGVGVFLGGISIYLACVKGC